MNRLRLPLLAAPLLVAALAGCTAATPTSSPTTSAAPAATAATPTESTTPTEPEPAADATCENVLTDAEYAQLAGDGLDAAEEIRPVDDVLTGIVDDGGLVCQWRIPQTDIQATYGRIDESEEAWAAREQSALDAGYTVSDVPFPGTLQGTDPADPGFGPVLAYSDGTVHFAGSAELLSTVRALQD